MTTAVNNAVMHLKARRSVVAVMAIASDSGLGRTESKLGAGIMNISDPKSVTVPEIALIAATRGAIGFGAGLLLA